MFSLIQQWSIKLIITDFQVHTGKHKALVSYAQPSASPRAILENTGFVFPSTDLKIGYYWDSIRYYSTIFNIIRQYLALLDIIQNQTTIFVIVPQYSTLFNIIGQYPQYPTILNTYWIRPRPIIKIIMLARLIVGTPKESRKHNKFDIG